MSRYRGATRRRFSDDVTGVQLRTCTTACASFAQQCGVAVTPVCVCIPLPPPLVLNGTDVAATPVIVPVSQGLSNGRVHSWPLRDFAPSVEVPVVTCQREGCNACAQHASSPDDITALCKPYERHQSPSRRDLDIAVKQAARVRWRDEYAAKVDAQVSAEISSSPGLDEEAVRTTVTSQVETEMERAIRDELCAARFVPKLRTCTRCWNGKPPFSACDLPTPRSGWRRAMARPASGRHSRAATHWCLGLCCDVAVAYCSKSCQGDDWRLHKSACVKRPKPAKPASAATAAAAALAT